MVRAGLRKFLTAVPVTVSLAATAATALAAEAKNEDPRIVAALGNEVLQLFEDAPSVTRIVVNDRTVFEDRDSKSVALINAYQVKGRWLAVFQHTSEAKDCPVRFRVLDLGNPVEPDAATEAVKPGGKGGVKVAAKPAAAPAGTARVEPRMSALFGTCSDTAEIAAAESGLTVSMPQPQGGTPVAWTYRNGQMARTR